MLNARSFTAALILITIMSRFASAQNTGTTITGSVLNYTLPERGGFVKETTGASNTLAIGYGSVNPTASTTPTGVAILEDRQNGILVSEAGVPGTTAMLSGRMYAEINGTLNTGVAFANPNAFDVAVSFGFTDLFGNNIDNSSFTLAANGQVARFLNEAPFGIATGFAGTFTFSASAPIGVIGLRTFVNERSEFLMTTQPVTPLPNPVTAGNVLLAHFAEGGGWRTQVILVNTTDTPISGTVQFFSEGTDTTSGIPLTLNVNGQVANSFAYSINARSSAKLATSGLGTTVVVGSVLVTPGAANPPSAYTVFTFSTGGVTVSQTTVQSVTTGTAFRSFVETNSGKATPGTIETGIAVANNSSVPALVNFQLTDMAGASVATAAPLTVPAQGHISRTVPELFPTIDFTAFLAPFRGVLRMTSSNFVAVASLRIRFNERGDVLVTTTPVSNEASPSSIAQLLFPQVLDGAGFTSELVLFSGILGQISSGTVQFTGQTGLPLILTVR
jgi:hypothetical protein